MDGSFIYRLRYHYRSHLTAQESSSDRFALNLDSYFPPKISSTIHINDLLEKQAYNIIESFTIAPLSRQLAGMIRTENLVDIYDAVISSAGTKISRA